MNKQLKCQNCGKFVDYKLIKFMGIEYQCLACKFYYKNHFTLKRLVVFIFLTAFVAAFTQGFFKELGRYEHGEIFGFFLRLFIITVFFYFMRITKKSFE